MGFEPTDTCASPVFKTGSFNHSDISPYVDRKVRRKRLAIISQFMGICQQQFQELFRKKVEENAAPRNC